MATKPNILKKCGTRVRALREQNGWSQETLAEKCELDRTYISGIERGLRNVSLVNLEIISKAFKMSLSELFNDL